MKTVTIYTDGGAQPNPGPGGYGVVLRFGEHVKELSGGFRLTTNNRMEILAAVAALEALADRGTLTDCWRGAGLTAPPSTPGFGHRQGRVERIQPAFRRSSAR